MVYEQAHWCIRQFLVSLSDGTSFSIFTKKLSIVRNSKQYYDQHSHCILLAMIDHFSQQNGGMA